MLSCSLNLLPKLAEKFPSLEVLDLSPFTWRGSVALIHNLRYIRAYITFNLRSFPVSFAVRTLLMFHRHFILWPFLSLCTSNSSVNSLGDRPFYEGQNHNCWCCEQCILLLKQLPFATLPCVCEGITAYWMDPGGCHLSSNSQIGICTQFLGKATLPQKNSQVFNLDCWWNSTAKEKP